METKTDAYQVARWESNLEEVDREVARLSLLCRVEILQPGVVDRLLQGDDSVCGVRNRLAFRKLRDLLLMHFAIRQMSTDALGQRQTTTIEAYVIDRLKKSFPELAANWPPP